MSKISGPLLDRIDLHVEVTPVKFDELTDERTAESSDSVRERVIKAREIQSKRFEDYDSIYNNAFMTPHLIRTFCGLSK